MWIHTGGKAKEVLREARGQTYAPFLARWQNDDVYRASQLKNWLHRRKRSYVWTNELWQTTVINCRGKNCGGTDKMGLTQKKYWWNLATRQEFRKELELHLQVVPHHPASQNPNRGRRRSSSSKRGEHGGAMDCGTPDRLGAKIHGVSAVIRHPNSLCTEH